MPIETEVKDYEEPFILGEYDTCSVKKFFENKKNA
jgi:hypothetical protein